MFQDMRVNHFTDDKQVRCNKVFNMINMIRNDVSCEREHIFDYDTVTIAIALAIEILALEEEGCVQHKKDTVEKLLNKYYFNNENRTT